MFILNGVFFRVKVPFNYRLSSSCCFTNVCPVKSISQLVDGELKIDLWLMTSKMLRAFSLAELSLVTSIVVCNQRSRQYALSPRAMAAMIAHSQCCSIRLWTWTSNNKKRGVGGKKRSVASTIVILLSFNVFVISSRYLQRTVHGKRVLLTYWTLKYMINLEHVMDVDRMTITSSPLNCSQPSHSAQMWWRNMWDLRRLVKIWEFSCSSSNNRLGTSTIN